MRGKSKLARLSDDALLDMRFRELGLGIDGTWLDPLIQRLYAELDNKGIVFHPPCFLADEWLCPDEEPIIGIAFFLADRRLMALEKQMMLEVEGGDKKWCMKLLRHEAGHAINYAYYLYRRKLWKETFGEFKEEYPDRYRFRPYSKKYVRHLDDCYAQYHPDEDFAETFAVWLDPRSGWRRRYKGWKAIEKLEAVDEMMQSIVVGEPPRKITGKRLWDVTRMQGSLRKHYKKKREFYAEDYPDFHDYHLRRIFSEAREGDAVPAATFIRSHRRALLDTVASCAGEKKYIIGDLLKSLAARCRELKLYARPDATETMMSLATYVTALTMNYLYTGRFKKEKS